MPKRAFSGVKPSGELHIGNYLGAIKQWLKFQNEYEVVFGIMDEHAITVPQDPEKLRQRTLEVAMIYLASGLNPQKTTLMIQSRVPAHVELGWILGTITPMGELTRMTQYKDAIAKKKEVYSGLFNYPVLMAADILLYHAEIVPVGEDQVQHVELARSIAERFNSRYGPTFTLPNVVIQRETARIMALDKPRKKMSKSDESDRGYILMTDKPEQIIAKLKAAVTDSGKEIIYDPIEKPAISNLLIIFSEFTGKTLSEIIAQYVGKNYTEFKSDLAEAIIAGLAPIQERFNRLKGNEAAVIKILEEGSARASQIANATIAEVKRKVGFL